MSVTPLERTATGHHADPWNSATIDRPFIDRRSVESDFRPSIHRSWEESYPSNRSQTGARSSKKAKAGANVVVYAALYLTVFGVSYFAFALAGQVMVERARCLQITAKARTLEAQRAETRLRQHVDELTSASSIQTWAASNHFVPPDEQVAPGPNESKRILKIAGELVLSGKKHAYVASL